MSTLPFSRNPQTSKPGEAVAAPKRRSARLTISIPVVVRGKDERGAPFAEQGQTLLVSLHGAMIALPRPLPLDSDVVIENPASQKSAEAVVLWCKQKMSQPTCHEVAVELKQPQDLWGICFPLQDREKPAGARAYGDAVEVVAGDSPVASSAPGAAPVSPTETHRSAPEGAGASAPQTGIPSMTKPDQAVPRPVPAARQADEDREEAITRFKASLRELCAANVEEMRLVADAHVRLFSEALARRVLASREATLNELEKTLTEICRGTLEVLRKQMEQELETFLTRASAHADQLEERVLRALESRIGSIQLRVVPVQAAKD